MLSPDTPITVRFTRGVFTVPLQTLLAAIAASTNTKEKITYHSPFGTITFKP